MIKTISFLMCIWTSFTLLPFSLSKQQKKEIGKKVWHNETGGKFDTLVFWNENEPFLSLGIGHFIWYPNNTNGTFAETFPDLLDYFIHNNVKLPYWLKHARKRGAPWKTRSKFNKILHTKCIQELRQLLYDTMNLQVEFIIDRLRKSWSHILKTAHPHKRRYIQNHFNNLLQSPNGIYALIDYVHFKGEGTKKTEEYNGVSWGLLQVLENMPDTTTPKTAVTEFIKAAKHVLQKRVANAPLNKKAIEKKWLKGWLNRIDTYLNT